MKNNKKYQILTLIIVIIGVISLCYLMRNKDKLRDYPQIEADGVIRIVTNYDPVGYYVEDSIIGGFNHDLIKVLQNYTSLKFEVSLEASIEKSIEGLMNNKYDIIIRNIPTTTRIKDSLNFTNPIAQDKLVLVQRKKEFNNGIETISSHLDLAGKTIHVPQNSPMILRIQNLSREIGDTIYFVEDPIYGAEQLAMKVAAGEIDYSISDERITLALSNTLPEIDYNLLIGFTHFEAWALRPYTPILLDSLNTWISRIKKTSEYENIYQQYYK